MKNKNQSPCLINRISSLAPGKARTMSHRPSLEKMQQRIAELEQLVANYEHEKTNNQARLKHLESIISIDKAISQTPDLEQMLEEAVKTILSIFQSDRAWLLYPCDPNTPTWRVPVEHTVPEYPGAGILNQDMPMVPYLAEHFRTALETGRPVIYGPGADRPLPHAVELYSTQSQMLLAIHPRLGKPWLLGMHQCTHARLWSQDEQNLFYDLGSRLADGLSNTLFSRDLKKSEAALRQAHEELEQRVEERTLELREANVQLQKEIIDRKKAEKSLRASEERYRIAFETNPDAMVISGLEDGRFVDVNRGFTVVSGYSREDVLGKNSLDIGFWNDQGERKKMVEKLKKDDHVKNLEAKFRCKNGRVITGLLSAASIRLHGQQYILSITKDIENLKQAEKALRQSEASLSQIVQGNAIPTYVINKTHHITHWNAACENLTALAAETMIGTSRHQEIFYSGTRPTMADLIVDGGSKKEIEHCYGSGYRKSKILPEIYEAENFFPELGSGNKWIFITTVPLRDEAGQIIGALETLQDITDRKQAEKELIKAQKLESTGILAGGIAHDFNNMLTAVIGNLSLATLMVSPEDEVFERLTEAEKAISRAQDLTQQLLTFSKGGAPVTKIVSAAELIQDSATFALRGSNVKSGYSIADDLWPVDVDEGQISQVIQNLVTNADQAMPDGGALDILAENRILRMEDFPEARPGHYIHISVRDHGAGIPEEYINKIFDPYFTTKQNGNGLGLAICYSIIRNHEGIITVESEIGSGTSFHIYLPASPDTLPVHKETAEGIVPGEGRILVMDDEEIVRKIAKKILRHAGYDVALSSDGQETLGLYKQAIDAGQPFDVVIMDLTIPGGMGGKEAVQKLLEIDPRAKAVVSSGYSNDPVMADFKKHGFRGVAAKPYSIHELTSTVQKVLLKDSDISD